MYVHPQEIDYNIDTLFELVDASGLEFLGFSNPRVWDLERLLGKSPELMQRAEGLGDRQRYRLIELLDPDTITHYEFFLGRPPLEICDWSSDADLLSAIPALSPCIDGWDSRCVFNYDYQIINLSESEWGFLKACEKEAGRAIAQILQDQPLPLDSVRTLQRQQLLLLTPAT